MRNSPKETGTYSIRLATGQSIKAYWDGEQFIENGIAIDPGSIRQWRLVKSAGEKLSSIGIIILLLGNAVIAPDAFVRDYDYQHALWQSHEGRRPNLNAPLSSSARHAQSKRLILPRSTRVDFTRAGSAGSGG